MKKNAFIPLNCSPKQTSVKRNKNGSQNRALPLLIAVCVFLAFTLNTPSIGAQNQSASFNMQEVSVFDEPDIPESFIVGIRAESSFESIPEVTSYPVFKSEKVLYGSVRLGRELFRPDSGQIYYFAIDESEGTDTGYDRFYFDLNLDGNLSNDELFPAQNEPPEGALWNITSAKRHICFEYMTLSLDSDNQSTSIPVEIMPRLTLTEGGGRLMRFVAAKVRKGLVEIAGHKYNAFLGYPFLIYPAYDHPGTSLYLIPEKGPTHTRYYMNFLTSMHEIDGKLYCFSATPDGSKLTTKPYDGPFGTFKVRSPQLFCPNKDVYGALASKEAIVEINHPDDQDRKKLSSVKIPVGDYLPMLVDVRLNNISISISYNFYSDGKLPDDSKEKIFGIKISEDKPFILDFSNEPALIFASPAKDTKIKPGDELKVAAVLVDPKLDIMIRNLRFNDYNSQLSSSIKSYLIFIPPFIVLALAALLLKKIRRLYRILIFSGSVLGIIGLAVNVVILYSLKNNSSYSDYKSLGPTVRIRRETGQIVASGSMPFG